MRLRRFVKQLDKRYCMSYDNCTRTLNTEDERGAAMLSINYKDPRPIYEQVRDSLRQLILSGAIKPEEKLPSVRELAGSLAINPNTIQRAYRELEADGLIYTVAGKGAFAASDGKAAVRRKEELMIVLRQTLQELKLLETTQQELVAEIQSVYGKEVQG